MHEHEPGEQHFGAAAQAAEWDTRYRERDGAMWSGRPNGRLVAEVAAVTPGRALDLGCGEGADAIWLAQRGWTVTAIDISEVAICRAREASNPAGASVEWICGDALQTPFRAGSFDLVSMQYPALPKAAGEAAVRSLLDTVRPGELLLAVYENWKTRFPMPNSSTVDHSQVREVNSFHPSAAPADSGAARFPHAAESGSAPEVRRRQRTFRYPKTRAEASAEIKRLKATRPASRLDHAVERAEARRDAASGHRDAAAVRDDEIEGYGSHGPLGRPRGAA
jgi:SAM-dependent methyltransferase